MHLIVISPLSFLTRCLFFLQLGVLIDRRVLIFVLPVFSFIFLYSKLPHKVSDFKCEVQNLVHLTLLLDESYFWMKQELRFIISSVPMLNLSAAVAANRMCVASFFLSFFAFICWVDSENNRELELLIAMILVHN